MTRMIPYPCHGTMAVMTSKRVAPTAAERKQIEKKRAQYPGLLTVLRWVPKRKGHYPELFNNTAGCADDDIVMVCLIGKPDDRHRVKRATTDR